MLENNQKTIFLQNEGNQWYNRNKKSITDKNTDPIIDLLLERKIIPKTVLEIGCSNGWRLNIIHKSLSSECFGIEPSFQAIEDGSKLFNNIILKQGTADEIPFRDKKFDLIIFGFCLYLCDRNDLFKIVYEADRFLKENGYIVIYDFEPTFPYKNKYQYYDGIYSYKMNHSELFLSNPNYFLVSKSIFTHYGLEKIEDPNERVSLSLLMKNSENAYVTNPFN